MEPNTQPNPPRPKARKPGAPPIWLTATLAWFGAAVAGVAASAETTIAANPMIDIAYVEPRDPNFTHYYVGLQKRKVLEELQAFLSPLILPTRIAIHVEQCDAPNRLYEHGGPVVLCYEYIDALNQLAKKIPADGVGPLGVTRDDAVVGAFIQATLQRAASAVFDVYQTPIWGREQDAADKLAAYVMMQFGPTVAHKLMTGAAYFFAASDHAWTGADFSRSEGAEAQRYYNYLCVAYGFDKRLFSAFSPDTGHANAASPALTFWRAATCPYEFAAIQWAYRVSIAPHVDPEKLSVVLKQDWLNWGAN